MRRHLSQYWHSISCFFGMFFLNRGSFKASPTNKLNIGGKATKASMQRGGGGEYIQHIRHSIRAAVRTRYSANGQELIKDMCCRQLGRPLSTSQPIKGELSMSSFVGQQVHILHPYLFKKGHFPQEIWLKICVWNPKHLPDLNPRDGKWEIFGPKISSRVRNYIR